MVADTWQVHFFDDDLRYVNGLGLYASHFPRCARNDDGTHGQRVVRYWSEPPPHTSEVLLEDTASGDVVGWDAELNIPGDIARTLMVIPAPEVAGGGVSSTRNASRLGEEGPDSPYSPYSIMEEKTPTSYWLADSASSQLLYNRDWVLRAAPLRRAQLSLARRFQFIKVPQGVDTQSKQDRQGDVRGTTLEHAPSFWLVDPSTSRMLYWRDDVVRVRPWHDRDPSASWRLRWLSDEDCPHWAAASRRLVESETDMRWARRVAEVAYGACTNGCERSPLVRAIASLLTPSHAFSRLLTPPHAPSRLITPSHTFSRLLTGPRHRVPASGGEQAGGGDARSRVPRDVCARPGR